MARMTDEERALREADKAYKRRVKDAERAVASAQEGTLIASYGNAKLYADRVVHGDDVLALEPNTRTDVQATGTKTTGKNVSDTRELYLTVENEHGGVTIKCKPDDGEHVRAFAQKIRVAEPGAATAATARAKNTEAAAQKLREVRADRAEIEAAERALPTDAIEKVRRRQRYAWIKWAGGGLAALILIVTIAGGSSDEQASTPPPPPAREPAQPPPQAAPLSPREKLEDTLARLDAKIESTSGREISIEAKTPQGGFDGASTGDLNRKAGQIFKAIHGDAAYRRASGIVFKGGLVDTRTGRNLPDVNTGIYEMSRADAAAVDWADEDRLFAIDWKNFRVFAHRALKQDE